MVDCVEVGINLVKCQKRNKRFSEKSNFDRPTALKECKFVIWYGLPTLFHRVEYPDVHGEGDLAAQDGGEYPLQRAIQRRCPPAEVLHGGVPFQEAQGERRGSATILCGGQP